MYGHFEARLRERVETSRLAETVVPYYRRALRTLFDGDADRELGRRAVELMTLLAASPLERRRDARELAEMLLARVSTLDPSANTAYLERAVLEPLARHGAYVVARPGAPVTYEVALEADASLTAARLMEQARAQVRRDDRGVIDTLLELGASPSLSVPLLRQAGRARRQVIWQQTLRHVLVAAGRLPDLTRAGLDELDAARARTGAEVAVFVAEPELADTDAGSAPETAASARL
ncbi:MAG TPA: hypothetical protein VFA92_12690, partial [Candidatus Binatia bacterium]|nr:hypothetical protein [Candidatus Binatia bacterium]